jgi:hypothetical protein
MREMPEETGAQPALTPYFASGVEHFNAMRFWEAHEAWEHLWLPADGEVVEFYQGLIQLAAAYHHMRRGTFSGATRLFDASLRRLQPFPAGFHGLDREAAVAVAASHRSASAAASSLGESDYPKLTLLLH